MGTGSVFKKIMMFSIALFACSLIFGVKASCPDNGSGWIEIGDSCYLVSNDSISWYEAQEFCWQNGGYLTEIDSMEEDLAIYDGLGDQFYWIGLNDIEEEGKWVWSESHREADYLNWDAE